MSSEFLQGFRLGPWAVRPLRGEITGTDGQTHHLEPKVMDVFVGLAAHAGDLVTRDELIRTVWPEQDVTDEPLTRAVGKLRRVLHDQASAPDFIETVPKRGYRLKGQITRLDGTPFDDGHSRPLFVVPFRTRHAAILALVIVGLGSIYFAIDPEVPSENRAPDSIASSPAEFAITHLEWEGSIAVLPFINLSDDPANELFADGLSIDIATLLSKVPGLKVIGRRSSFAFKGKNEDVRVIGQTLGVDAVLEGSVRKSGERLRITAHLVDVKDGARIWSETFNRTMTDIFQVQEEVATAILDTMQLQTRATPDRGRPTEDSEAYALFLQAQAIFNMYAIRDALEPLEKAIERDPDFAEAHEMMAWIYWWIAGTFIEANEGRLLMNESANRALAINPDLLFARAMYFSGTDENYFYGEEILAFEQIARAFPSHPYVLDALVYTYLATGYFNEALATAKRYVSIDPLSPAAHVRLSETLLAVGRVPEALDALDTAGKLGSKRYSATSALYGLLLGDEEAAINGWETYFGQKGYEDVDWAHELFAKGRDPVTGAQYIDERIDEIVESMLPDDRYYTWRTLTLAYLAFGHLDRLYEIIFELHEEDDGWTNAETIVSFGTIIRASGFTADPRYMHLAKSYKLPELWDQRGPPDFCTKTGGSWKCE